MYESIDSALPWLQQFNNNRMLCTSLLIVHCHGYSSLIITGCYGLDAYSASRKCVCSWIEVKKESPLIFSLARPQG